MRTARPAGIGVPLDFGAVSTPSFGVSFIPRIFYIDPAGSDANDGLTTGTAWQTIAKLNASYFFPGDQILLKRGGVWRENPGLGLLDPQHRGVTIGAYGAGADPIISGGLVVTGFTLSAGSTYSVATVALVGTPPIVTFTAAGVTTVLALGSGTGTLTANQYIYSAGSLYINLGGTNPSTGTVEVPKEFTPGYSEAANATFTGLDFRFGRSSGFEFFNSHNGWLLTGCSFRYCTYTGNSGTVQVTSGSAFTDAPNRITSCVFDQLGNDGIWVHSTRNIEIDHNTITNTGGMVGDVQSDGIQFEDIFGTPDSNGFWIHDNVVTMGAQTPKGCILVNCDPSIGTATGIIERNTCTGGNFGIGITSSGVKARNNVCANQSSSYGGGFHLSGNYALDGIEITYNIVYGSDRDGIVIQDSANDQQVTIAHNTIVDTGRAQIYIGSPVYGTIANNVIWNTGAAPSLRTLYIVSVSGGKTLVCDYNLFQTAFANYLRFGGTTYSTLAAWRAATGFDAHSISGDPVFTNSAGHDYTLTASSPALDAGTVISGINQVVVGSAPDLGVFEFTPSVVTLRQMALTGVGA